MLFYLQQARKLHLCYQILDLTSMIREDHLLFFKTQINFRSYKDFALMVETDNWMLSSWEITNLVW